MSEIDLDMIRGTPLIVQKLKIKQDGGQNMTLICTKANCILVFTKSIMVGTIN